MLTAACLPWYLNWNAFNDNVHLSPYFYFEYLNYKKYITIYIRHHKSARWSADYFIYITMFVLFIVNVYHNFHLQDEKGFVIGHKYSVICIFQWFLVIQRISKPFRITRCIIHTSMFKYRVLQCGKLNLLIHSSMFKCRVLQCVNVNLLIYSSMFKCRVLQCVNVNLLIYSSMFKCRVL